MPGKVWKGLVRGQSAPATASIPKYIMPSPRPWNWPPDWPIATRDQIVAGMLPNDTPGCVLLKGKGLARSLTVGELSELMKQKAATRREPQATLTRPQSDQQTDRLVRMEETRGAELCVESTSRRISIRHSRAVSEDSEADELSASSSGDETIRLDPGIASDSSSEDGSVRSDVMDGEDGEGEAEAQARKTPVFLRSKNVRGGREEVDSGNGEFGVLTSGKKWSSLLRSLRERL